MYKGERGKRLSPEIREELLLYINKGLSNGQIEQRCGVSQKTITAYRGLDTDSIRNMGTDHHRKGKFAMSDFPLFLHTFTEAARLFQCRASYLIKTLKPYFKNIDLLSFSMVKSNGVYKKAIIASESTCRNMIYRIFDAYYVVNKVEIEEKIRMDKIRSTITSWEPGIIAAHVVTLSWNESKNKTRSSCNYVKRDNRLLLLVERCNSDNRKYYFHFLEPDASDLDVAEIVIKFIATLKNQVTQVRLVSEKREEQIVPIAVDDVHAFKEALGAGIDVEVDIPSIGSGIILVPGSYPSFNALRDDIISNTGLIFS